MELPLTLTLSIQIVHQTLSVLGPVLREVIAWRVPQIQLLVQNILFAAMLEQGHSMTASHAQLDSGAKKGTQLHIPVQRVFIAHRVLVPLNVRDSIIVTYREQRILQIAFHVWLDIGAIPQVNSLNTVNSLTMSGINVP